MKKISPDYFDWITWRNGSPLDLFEYQLRSYNLKSIKSEFIRCVIGYCDGEELICRPKTKHKAVLFFKDNEYYWFHFTNEEFRFLTKA